MNGYDVVVVGGRVAGASTSLLLARAGLRVAVVDRAPYGSDSLSTHGLMRAGVLQLARWCLLDQVVALGTPPVRRTLFRYPGADPVQVSIKPSAGVDALYAPRRHLLDRILVDAAAEAGAEVLHDVPVVGLVRDGTDRVSGVRARSRHGTPLRLDARLVVGADGVRSRVAQDVGAPVVRQGRAAGAVMYRYYTGLPAAGYEWAYGEGSAAGLIPTNDARTCLFVGTAPTRMRELRRAGQEEAFATLLRDAAPSLVDRVREAEPASRLHGWAGMRGYVRQSWGPGWALVGDAGYFTDPITTHGITGALRDAELLAEEILAAARGSVPASVALTRYQVMRDRLSAPIFEATDAVAAYDWDATRVQRLLRQVASAMSDELDHVQRRGIRLSCPALVGKIPPDSSRVGG